MLNDFPDRLAVICQKREEMEAEWVKSLPDSSEAFERASALEEEWLEKISDMSIEGKSKRSYRKYWRKQNCNAGLVINE